MTHPKLEDLQAKRKRKFTEVAPCLSAASLLRVFYKLDGEMKISIISEGILQKKMSTEVTFLEVQRLVRRTDLKDRTVHVFKWVTMMNATDSSLWPLALGISNLRLIGTEHRGLIVDKSQVSEISFHPSTVVSRLKMATEENGMITFEWVAPERRKEED